MVGWHIQPASSGGLTLVTYLGHALPTSGIGTRNELHLQVGESLTLGSLTN
jgi:hypothetical protein